MARSEEKESVSAGRVGKEAIEGTTEEKKGEKLVDRRARYH